MPQIVRDAGGDAPCGAPPFLGLQRIEDAPGLRGAEGQRDEQRGHRDRGETDQRVAHRRQRFALGLLDHHRPAWVRQPRPPGQDVFADGPVQLGGRGLSTRYPARQRRLGDWLAGQHVGAERGRARGEEAALGVEGEREPALADADALHLAL